MSNFIKENRDIIKSYSEIKKQLREKILQYINEELNKYGSICLLKLEKRVYLSFNKEYVRYVCKFKDGISVLYETEDGLSINTLETNTLLEIAKAIEEVVSKYYE